jgi:hypothetical protein
MSKSPIQTIFCLVLNKKPSWVVLAVFLFCFCLYCDLLLLWLLLGSVLISGSSST